MAVMVLDERDKQLLESVILQYVGGTFDPIMHPEKTMVGMEGRIVQLEVSITELRDILNSLESIGIRDIVVNETDADGAGNTVTFYLTDGSTHTLTVKNGSRPIKGVDYWTPADKASMVDELGEAVKLDLKGEVVQEILEELQGLPVFGVVDEDNTITITSMLSNGVYDLKYETTSGLVDIGTIIIGNGEDVDPDEPIIPDEPDEPITPTETNQIRLSVDSEGNEYVGKNGEDGYKVGYRISTSVYITEAECAGMCCTGYIPYEANQVIRMKNVTISGTQTPYFVKYDQQKGRIENLNLASVLVDDGNGVYTGSLAYTGWFRITCGVIDDTSIITLDTEIE